MSTVEIQGKTYNIPPLNVGQVRRNWSTFVEIITGLQSATTELEQIAAVTKFTDAQAEILLCALKNEYPHLSMDDIDTLHPADLRKAVNHVIDSVTKAFSGEEQAAPVPPEVAKRARRSR